MADILKNEDTLLEPYSEDNPIPVPVDDEPSEDILVDTVPVDVIGPELEPEIEDICGDDEFTANSMVDY